MKLTISYCVHCDHPDLAERLARSGAKIIGKKSCHHCMGELFFIEIEPQAA